jgi:hypothetical protein
LLPFWPKMSKNAYLSCKGLTCSDPCECRNLNLKMLWSRQWKFKKQRTIPWHPSWCYRGFYSFVYRQHSSNWIVLITIYCYSRQGKCRLMLLISIVRPFLVLWFWMQIIPFIWSRNRVHDGCERSKRVLSPLRYFTLVLIYLQVHVCLKNYYAGWFTNVLFIQLRNFINFRNRRQLYDTEK